MIFKLFTIYRKTKQGIDDPVGLAADEISDAVMGTLLIPLVIVIPVLILLGILSFSSLITQPSVIAQIFFWIILIGTGIFVWIVVAIKNWIKKKLR
jgi:hypothetical protein